MSKTTRRHVGWIALLAAGVTWPCCAKLHAQERTTSQFGTQGTVGQIGTNLTGSMVGQSSTQGTMLGGTSGQPFGNTQIGNAAGGFVGQNNSTGGFVGDQRVTQQAGVAASQRQFATAGATGRANNQARAGNQGGGRVPGQVERYVVRPRQEIAFQYPGRDFAVLAGEVTGRFDRLVLRSASLQGVAIEITPQGAAVLTGAVLDANAKKLAEIVVSLEPGVRSVVNELTLVATEQP